MSWADSAGQCCPAEMEDWRMANYKDTNKKKRNQKRISVNMTTAIIMVAVIAVLMFIIGGVIVANITKTGNGKNVTGSVVEVVAGTADGEIADFEESGYLTLGSYKKVKTEVTPTEEEILSELQSAATKKKTKTAMKNNQKVKKGDYVFIDFVGYVDGKSSDSLQGEDEALRIGDYEYENDFEDGMIGKTAGKTYTIPVHFDDSYDDGEVAGKTVDFSITIHGKFDDSYAKWLSKGKYKTVEAYKKYVKQKLKKENLDNAGDLAWTELADSCKVKKYPKGLVEAAKKDLENQYKNFAKASGTTYDDLLASLSMDDELVLETARDTVKDRMIAKTIAARENLKLDDESYRKYLMQMMEYKESDNMSTEALVTEYARDYSGNSKDDMLIEHVKKFVGDFAEKK